MALSVRRNLAFKLALDLSSKALSLGLTLWLARSLGPSGWGSMQWALAWAGLAGALADLGLSHMALRQVTLAKGADRREWVLAAWALKGILWSTALLVLGLSLWVTIGGLEPVLLGAAAFTVGLSLGEFNGTLFSASERLDLEFRTALASKLGQVLAAALALALGAGAAGVLLAMAAAAWLGWAGGLAVLWRQWPPRKKVHPLGPRIMQLAATLWPFGLFPLLTMAYVKVDTLLLEHLRGLQAVGEYQAAYKWLEALGFLPAAFAAAAFPALLRSGGEGAAGVDKRFKALRGLAGLGCVATAFLAGLAAWLPLLYGPQYGAASALLVVLALACLASFPYYALISLVVAEGRQNRLLLAALLGLLLNLGGNLLLIPRFGAMGAAWMTVATEFLMLGFVAWSLRDLLPWLRLAWAAGLGTVGGILALALAQVTGPWGILMATGGALAWALAWDLLPRAEVARLWKAR